MSLKHWLTCVAPVLAMCFKRSAGEPRPVVWAVVLLLLLLLCPCCATHAWEAVKFKLANPRRCRKLSAGGATLRG